MLQVPDSILLETGSWDRVKLVGGVGDHRLDHVLQQDLSQDLYTGGLVGLVHGLLWVDSVLLGQLEGVKDVEHTGEGPVSDDWGEDGNNTVWNALDQSGSQRDMHSWLNSRLQVR